MGSRAEILNDGGYRSDGRRQFELRDFKVDLNQQLQGQADGSAVVWHGLTNVCVNVFGPREPKMRSQSLHGKVYINVQVTIAPFSTSERRKRAKNDRRTLELAASIRDTFEPVVQTHLYPRSEIDVFVYVLQQDGGVLQACINATTLALITAGISVTDYVAAVTCGVHTTSPLLDLTNNEESDLPHLTLAVMPRSGKVTLATMETRLHVDRFEEILQLARDAGIVLGKEMKAQIRARTEGLVKRMKGHTHDPDADVEMDQDE